MKRVHNRQLAALLASPPLASPDEVKALLRRIEDVPAVHALVAAGCSGARLVEMLAADRALAVEFARAATHGREIAKAFRRVAGIFSEGAERTFVALHVRPDRVEILSEAL